MSALSYPLTRYKTVKYTINPTIIKVKIDSFKNGNKIATIMSELNIAFQKTFNLITECVCLLKTYQAEKTIMPSVMTVKIAPAQ